MLAKRHTWSLFSGHVQCVNLSKLVIRMDPTTVLNAIELNYLTHWGKVMVYGAKYRHQFQMRLLLIKSWA